MLKGFDEQGNLRNVKVTEEGEILVKSAGSDSIKSGNEKETTLYASVSTIGVSEITIGVNEKVSEISVANYSETANVSVSIDEKNYVIAPGLALDLPINKSVGIVGLSATEEDTKVQYVIKGIISNSDVSGEIEITENGIVDVTDYASANVNVPIPSPTLQNKSITITENGTQTISADGGYYGLDEVEVTTNVNDLKFVVPDGLKFGYSTFSSLPSILSDAVWSNVSDFSYMFAECNALTNLDLSNFNTSNAKNRMDDMFFNCYNLTNLNLSSLDTSSVTNMTEMFAECNALTNLDLSNFNTSSVTDMYRMFASCGSLANLNLSNFDMSNVTEYSDMFEGVPTDCKIITNSETASWLNENFPDYTNIEIV